MWRKRWASFHPLCQLSYSVRACSFVSPSRLLSAGLSGELRIQYIESTLGWHKQTFCQRSEGKKKGNTSKVLEIGILAQGSRLLCERGKGFLTQFHSHAKKAPCGNTEKGEASPKKKFTTAVNTAHLPGCCFLKCRAADWSCLNMAFSSSFQLWKLVWVDKNKLNKTATKKKKNPAGSGISTIKYCILSLTVTQTRCLWEAHKQHSDVTFSNHGW